MTKSSEEGIGFDKVFFEAILKKAAQEGYIKHYHPDPIFEWVTLGRTKIALQMALLYGKIYNSDLFLTSFLEPMGEWYSEIEAAAYWNLLNTKKRKTIGEWYLEIGTAAQELQGLLENPRLPMGASHEINPHVVDFVKDCFAFKELLISNKSRAKRCFDPYNLVKMNYPYEYCNHKFDAMLKILGIISDSEENTITDIGEEFIGFDELKVRLEYGYKVTDSDLLEYLCSPFDNNVQFLLSSILGTGRELQHIKNLLEFSDEYSVPVLTDDVSVRKPSAKEINGLERVETAEYSRIALGVFFDEELRPVLPVVNSIKDVLRLRKDRRIADFRNKIFEWTMALKEGEANLGKIKKEMIEANKKLKTIGKCERVSTWITFLSLPIDVVLTLSGLPISIVTSIASFGVACTSKLLKQDYNWYLFGVQ